MHLPSEHKPYLPHMFRDETSFSLRRKRRMTIEYPWDKTQTWFVVSLVRYSDAGLYQMPRMCWGIVLPRKTTGQGLKAYTCLQQTYRWTPATIGPVEQGAVDVIMIRLLVPSISAARCFPSGCGCVLDWHQRRLAVVNFSFELDPLTNI
jgi:hypothetical protein